MTQRWIHAVTIRTKPKSEGEKTRLVEHYETEPMVASAEQVQAWIAMQHKDKTVEVTSRPA